MAKSKGLAPTTTSPAKMGEEMAYAQANSSPSPNLQYTPRKGASGGPEQATAGHRTGIQERLGAQYAPQMPLYTPNAAEANDTQKNVRILNSAVGNRDFYLKRQYGQVQQ